MEITDKIWLTSRTRMQTEKRLLSAAFHSNTILFWYSFFGVVVAVYNLALRTDSASQPVAWVILSILILAMSGFIQGFRFGTRATTVKQCYENLSALNQKLQQGQIDDEQASNQYQAILDSCENHTIADYYEMLCINYLQKSGKSRLKNAPTCYIWLCFIINRVKHCILIVTLYAFPVILYWILELGGYIVS